MSDRQLEFFGEMSVAVLDDAPPFIHLEDAGALGEMSTEDVPLAAGVDLAALQAGDTDPMQVIVELSAGKSKRGWNYGQKVLERYHSEIQAGGLPGYLGHQKPEDVSSQFPTPVTHWVGSKLVGSKLYMRGVVDKAADDLKRWIRSKRITTTSIFGIPKLVRSTTGEVQVVDFDPISNDWTPLKRNGMSTRLVYTGEMDRLLKEGEEPQGEQDAGPSEGGLMNFAEIMQKLRDVGAGPAKVIEAMGWEPTQVLGEMSIDYATAAPIIDKAAFEKGEQASKVVGEIAKLAGVEDFEKLPETVKAWKEGADNVAKETFEKRRDKVVGELVANEKGQKLVTRLMRIEETASDDDIKKAVGELLEDDFVKEQLAAFGGATKPALNPSGETKSGETTETKLPDGVERQRVSI